MSAPLPSERASKLRCGPLAVAMPGWRIEAVRINLGRQDGEVGPAVTVFFVGVFEHGSQDAVSVLQCVCVHDE